MVMEDQSATYATTHVDLSFTTCSNRERTYDNKMQSWVFK
jgi:hypothetical protein